MAKRTGKRQKNQMRGRILNAIKDGGDCIRCKAPTKKQDRKCRLCGAKLK